MCTALRDANIQTPDWVKIAMHLHVEIQLQVSVDDFLQGWRAYANDLQPSWIKLAEALEGTGSSRSKEAAETIRMKQGIVGKIKFPISQGLMKMGVYFTTTTVLFTFS